MTPTLEELLAAAKARWDQMTDEEQRAMLLRQAQGWARSEAQWARDFRAGLCERD